MKSTFLLPLRLPRKTLTFVFLSIFFLVEPNHVRCSDNAFKNSSGIITFHFDPVKIKIYNEKKQVIGFANLTDRTCNGFFIKHDNQVYFVTVSLPARIAKSDTLIPYENNLFYEILEDRKTPTQLSIVPAFENEEIRIVLDKFNSATGNKVREKRREGEREEKIDLLCINVTDSLRTKNELLLEYEQLAGESDKPAIDGENNIMIFGYPGADQRQGYHEETSRINSPGTFGTLSPFNGQEMSGFSFDLKLDEKDSGRLVCSTIEDHTMIIGIVKEALQSDSGESVGSIAIDSTAIRRIVDTLHKKAKVTDTARIRTYEQENQQ
ncbi:MAG: hypothetical protein ABH865_02925 [Candidatus Omnitrophota bacterium]